METTIDGILNRRLEIEQPRRGFRVAVDTVLLAAATRPPPNGTVLDLGCGAGGAMLALACRLPSTRVIGIEIMPEMADLCAANIRRNGMQARASVERGDAAELPAHMRGAFDAVMANPPYHEAAKHNPSPDMGKRSANTEDDGTLRKWLETAFSALREGGVLTLIHRADRRDEILKAAEAAGFGAAAFMNILPRRDAPPKRIVVTAVKGAPFAPPRQAKPLTLHGEAEKYTGEAEKILREAQELAMEFEG